MRRISAFALAVLLALAPLARASGSIILNASTDSLELQTSGAFSTDYSCSWVDSTATAFTPGATSGNVAAATTTTIVAAPAAATQRKISGCQIYNASGSTQTIIIKRDVSATEYVIFKSALLTLESVEWNEEDGFRLFDANGIAKNLLVFGAGTEAAAQRVTIATDSTGVLSVDDNGGALTVDASNLDVQIGGSDTVTVTAANLDVQIGGSDTVTVTASNLDVQIGGSDTVTVAQGTAANLKAEVIGTKTSNNAVPGATNIGVLPAVANAVAPTYTETDQVLLSTDLGGALRVTDGTGAMNVIVDSGTTAVTQATASNLKAEVIGTKTNNGAVPGATNVGALVAVANAAAPTQTETNLVALRVQLDGDLVVEVEDAIPTVTTVTNLTNLPNEGQQTAANSISVTPDTDNDAIGATAAAPPGEAVLVAGLTSGADTTGLMMGITVCDSSVLINTASATTTLLITGVANRHWRICSLNIVVGAAQGVAFITGTGATCGTSTVGVNGGTTGATGWQFAANGGLTQGSGLGEIMSSKVTGGATGDSLCIVTSTAAQTSGNISYAIY